MSSLILSQTGRASPLNEGVVEEAAFEIDESVFRKRRVVVRLLEDNVEVLRIRKDCPEEDSSKVADSFCISSKSTGLSFMSSVRPAFLVMTTVLPEMEYLLNISTLPFFTASPPNILTTTRSASALDGFFPF